MSAQDERRKPKINENLLQCSRHCVVLWEW